MTLGVERVGESRCTQDASRLIKELGVIIEDNKVTIKGDNIEHTICLAKAEISEMVASSPPACQMQ